MLPRERVGRRNLLLRCARTLPRAVNRYPVRGEPAFEYAPMRVARDAFTHFISRVFRLHSANSDKPHGLFLLENFVIHSQQISIRRDPRQINVLREDVGADLRWELPKLTVLLEGVP